MMKKFIWLSIATLVVTLGIVSNNPTKVQAAVTVASMDFDENNKIDILDLANLAERCNLPKNTSTVKYDLNVDGTIDLYDLVELSSVVGTKINKVPDNTNITSKFTDLSFRLYIYNKIGKSILQPILYSDVKNITTLSIQNKWITNLNGIEYFTSLTKLSVNYSLVTNLDLSSNIELAELNVDNNYIKSLNLSYNSRLTSLSTSNNELVSLDVSKNKRLISLNTSVNYLTNLDVSKNTKLTNLNCSSNKISSLDVSNNKNLNNLNSSYNKISNLNITRNTVLTNLNVSSNQLTSLDIGNNGALLNLYCNENKIKSLDISKNPKLTDLDCSKNEIKSLYSIKDTWKHNSYKFQYYDETRKKLINELKVTVRQYT